MAQPSGDQTVRRPRRAGRAGARHSAKMGVAAAAAPGEAGTAVGEAETAEEEAAAAAGNPAEGAGKGRRRRARGREGG